MISHSWVPPNSVFFFGDRLNLVNVSGCLVVFSGVVLYKIVFHLEKAKKDEAMPMRLKAHRDGMGGKLIENEHGFRDDVDEVGSVSSARGVELVGRHHASSSPKATITTMESIEEKEYVLPNLV